jgi:hypothetical protein
LPTVTVIVAHPVVWSSLKRGIRKNNASPNLNARVIDLVRIAVDQQLWQNCVRHVINIEDFYGSLNLPNLIITVDDTEKSDEDNNNDSYK